MSKENKSHQQAKGDALTPEVSSLTLKEVPSDLLGRVNAMAQLLNLNQPDYVLECLQEKTEELEEIQQKAKQWLQLRQQKKKRPDGAA